MPAELAEHSDTAPHFEYVWEWFCELRSPVNWREIEAWSKFSGVRPTRFEGRMLIKLDMIRNG